MVIVFSHQIAPIYLFRTVFASKHYLICAYFSSDSDNICTGESNIMDECLSDGCTANSQFVDIKRFEYLEKRYIKCNKLLIINDSLFFRVGHNEIIGVCRLGSGAEGLEETTGMRCLHTPGSQLHTGTRCWNLRNQKKRYVTSRQQM